MVSRITLVSLDALIFLITHIASMETKGLYIALIFGLVSVLLKGGVQVGVKSLSGVIFLLY